MFAIIWNHDSCHLIDFLRSVNDEIAKNAKNGENLKFLGQIAMTTLAIIRAIFDYYCYYIE
jgi:hypothetical protein